ncbi:hypothetical protein CPAR01_01408 [Colletotrichum paranaense]|uniref:Uncharacterized protein n=2 Tax=Colletotrichum acutatum species complex TaxID=2707335 RepID=A0AAI9UB59_9PEZI|nr:uncharacterized protein CPAR01_01408 [Colletotrichum paranaense]KAK1455089.1 hypothetical protein CMEL01_03849 [Colletotrichum melonis]KAK1547441.1 hypothetical protein CPAR01_01408 [Colletotrichum paranaense]
MLDCSTQFRLQKANQGPVSISREGQSRLSEISTQQTTPTLLPNMSHTFALLPCLP